LHSGDVNPKYKEQILANDLLSDAFAANGGTAVYESCVCWPLNYKILARHVLQEVRPIPEIEDEIKTYACRNFTGNMIGVHVRYGNQGDIMDHEVFWKDEKSAVDRICAAIELALEKFGSNSGLFLSTDTASIETKLLDRFPRAFVRPKHFRADGTGELHHLKCAASSDAAAMFEMGSDAIIDMFLLAECGVIIRFPPGSFFSHYASVFKRTKIAFSNNKLMPVIEY
jgi:hypothetical protein